MTDINKNKTITYVVSSGVCGLAAVIIAAVLDYLPMYVCLWGTVGVITGSCVSRIIFHVYHSDYSAEMWQVAIYHLISVIGVIGLIYANTWGWVSFFAALIVAMVFMGLGTRFIKYKGGTLLLYKLIHDKRYYPVGDKSDAEDDLARPLILYEGKPLTIDEALKNGLNDVAQIAKEKLMAIYGFSIDKEKK